MEVDQGMKLEETRTQGFSNISAVKVKKEYEEWIGCKELQDKLKEANDKCANLELDIGKKNSVIEWLEGKLMELKNDETRVLKKNNEELEKSIRNVKEECNELMIEIKVLEYGKNRAEFETEMWKAKYKELEIEVMELKKRLSADTMQCSSDFLEMFSGGSLHKANDDKGASDCTTVARTPPDSTPSKQYSDAQGFKGRNRFELKSTISKFLDFEGHLHKDISPAGSEPGVRSPFDPIAASDNDDELNTKRRKVGRGVAYVVSSDSEIDDDIPICRLKIKNQLTHSSDTPVKRCSINDSCFSENLSKRRLRRVGDRKVIGDLGECSIKSTGNQNNLGISENLNVTLDDDEKEEDESSSEGESLGGFIVKSSESSETDCDDSFSGDCSGESENESDIVAYKKVISGFRRERKDELKWDYEADMLADFAKCPELCMKAVCTVYRQQTVEEKSCKATILRNGRGFNQFHAFSGSALAEFLTDGDPKGDVKKSVKELQEYNSEGVEQCRKLATHYSKQLFEIYNNKEDPFFHC